MRYNFPESCNWASIITTSRDDKFPTRCINGIKIYVANSRCNSDYSFFASLNIECNIVIVIIENSLIIAIIRFHLNQQKLVAFMI